LADYSVIYFDPEGNVCRALMLSCADDAEAIERFDGLASDRPMELWHRGQRKRTYSPPVTEA
jgi:hypothetical protein